MTRITKKSQQHLLLATPLSFLGNFKKGDNALQKENYSSKFQEVWSPRMGSTS